MKFEFKGLNYDIANDLEDNTLYVFSNSNDKNELEKNIKDPFVKYKLITESEFWERYLLSDNIVLKEEKETVFYYNSLTNEQKNKLQINGYFDCIDIAYRYYSFMKECVDFKLEIENLNLYSWQEEKIKDMFDIHKQMIEVVKKTKRMPRYLLPLFSYTNDKYISNFSKIIFVDKFSFTKFEIEVLEKISNLVISLSVSENDYDMHKYILRGISLPNVLNKENIKIIECNDKFSQNISLINHSEDFKIFYDKDENTKNKLKKENVFLNQEEVLTCSNFNLSNTTNYRIIKSILNVIKNKTELGYKISDIYTLYSIKDFLNIFDIDKKVILDIKREHKSGNKYKNSVNYPQLEILDKFSNANKFEDIEEYLVKILNYVSEKDRNFELTYSFYEALTEINTLEFDFLDNFSTDYLTILLKYFDAKKVKIKLDNVNVCVKSINNLSSLKKEKLALINMQDSFKINVSNILSIRQRLEIGLPIKENKMLEVLHIYYKLIFNTNKIYISYIKNEEESKEELPFITDLIYTYGLEPEKFEISVSERASMLENILDKDNIEYNENEIYLSDQDRLKYDENFDIKEISVSAFLRLLHSESDYYLSKKIDVNEIYDDSVGVNHIGTMLHKLMEKVMLHIKENKIEISKDKINKLSNEVLNEYKGLFLEKYLRYVEYKYLSDIDEKISRFLYKLKRELLHENIEKIEIEKELSYEVKLDEDRVVKIKGIADLIITTDKSTYIIDFKTGKFKKERKKEYSNQVKLYSLMSQDDNCKEIKLILSFILDNDNYFTEIDYESSNINNEHIIEVLSNMISKKENYEVGKPNRYSDYKEVIICK